jgi:hypothetical protein
MVEDLLPRPEKHEINYVKRRKRRSGARQQYVHVCVRLVYPHKHFISESTLVNPLFNLIGNNKFYIKTAVSSQPKNKTTNRRCRITIQASFGDGIVFLFFLFNSSFGIVIISTFSSVAFRRYIMLLLETAKVTCSLIAQVDRATSSILEMRASSGV